MEIDIICCFALPILFTVVFRNAAKFIGKLLIKFYPLPHTDDKTTKVLSKNHTNINSESSENLISVKNTEADTLKKFPFLVFKPTLVPLLWFALCMLFYLFCAATIKSDNVIKIYSKRCNSYVSFDHLISIQSKATTINPCNETDTKVFQNFVTLWKEKNEVQKKLDKWANVIADNDTLPTIKEYYVQKIEVATEKMKYLNATWEPKFRIYKDCFFAANNSKRIAINIFCFASVIFFNICITLCFSATIYCAKYSFANQSIKKRDFKLIENMAHYMHITFIIYTCYVTFVLHKRMMENIPEIFLLNATWKPKYDGQQGCPGPLFGPIQDVNESRQNENVALIRHKHFTKKIMMQNANVYLQQLFPSFYNIDLSKQNNVFLMLIPAEIENTSNFGMISWMLSVIIAILLSIQTVMFWKLAQMRKAYLQFGNWLKILVRYFVTFSVLFRSTANL